jgi:uncharacterized integral membrane protein
LTGALRSAGSLLRKIVAALVLATLAILLIAFAVANRASVTLSFDPFNAAAPAASVTLPLFAVIIIVLILGVVIGGCASWLRHGRWRRTARRLERDLTRLREELEAHKRAAASATINVSRATEPPERLKLKPPVQ